MYCTFENGPWTVRVPLTVTLATRFALISTLSLETFFSHMSVAEIIDKLTILDLKLKNIQDPEKLAHIRAEKELLESQAPDVGPFRSLLYNINSILWDVEDQLRVHESQNNFGSEFILLARSVYFTNDLRSRVKTQISRIVGDSVKEMKSYVN